MSQPNPQIHKGTTWILEMPDETQYPLSTEPTKVIEPDFKVTEGEIIVTEEAIIHNITIELK